MTQPNDKNDENLGSFYMGRGHRSPDPERTLPKGALTGVAVLAFAGILWYAYPRASDTIDSGEVPVVKADAESYKTTPSDPGGMNVPHQDSTVFDSVESSGAQNPQGEEKLIARQEEPTILPLATPESAPVAAPEIAPEGEDLLKDAAPVAPTEAPVAAPEKPAEPAVEKPKAQEKTESKPAPKAAPKAESKPESKPAAPASSPTASGAHLQLGAFRSDPDAKAAWGKLQGKFPSLQGLSYRTQRVEQAGRGVFFRLQAIVPGGAAAARDLCATLKSAGGSCLVMK